jgi:hypothetical protein
MIEAWRVVPSIPKYEASTLGRIRVRATRKILSINTDTNGILMVNTNYRGASASRRVCRLVGEAWSRCFKPELRTFYRDGNRSNCQPSNLKWVPQSKVTGAPFSRNPKPTNQKETIQ